MSNEHIIQPGLELPQQAPPMADIHICGQCRTEFTSIDSFIEHKRRGCTPATTTAPRPALLGDGDGSPPPQAPIRTPPGGASGSKKRWHDTNKTPDRRRKNQQGATGSNEPVRFEIIEEVVSPSRAMSTPAKRKKTPSPEYPNQFIQMVMQQFKSPSSSQSSPPPSPSPQQHQPPPPKTKMEKRYKCNHEGCPFTTAHLKDIQRHVRIHTGERPYECSHCKKRFSRQDKLRIHLRIHTGDKPFCCQICDYRSVDGGSLKKHLRIHNDERPFGCQICDYRSRNSSQLIVHLRTHTGDTPFHCQQCDMKFKINSDLTRHMMTHTGEKPFQCTECEYRSALKSNLKLHIKSNHTNENRYQCEECGFGCCTKRQLKVHSHSHATTDPIKCVECGFTCFNKAVFRRHEQKQHGGGEVAEGSLHRCDHCDFVSRHADQVPKHVRKHHPELVMKIAVKKKRQKRQKHKHKKSSSAKKSDGSGVKMSCSKKPFACETCNAKFMRPDSLHSHKRQHERLNAVNLEEANRESMAYAVLQLQYGGTVKDPPEASQNLAEGRKDAGIGRDKPAVIDDLSTLLSAIESRQNAGEDLAGNVKKNMESLKEGRSSQQAGPSNGGSSVYNNSQSSEVLDVMDFSTEGLSEVEVTSSNSRQDAQAPPRGQSAADTDDQIVTVEFPRHDNKASPHMPPQSTTASDMQSSIPVSAYQPLQQTLSIPSTHYMAQPMPPAGPEHVIPMQPLQLSTTMHQLQVLQPVHTVTNAAPKLMNFASVAHPPQQQHQAILVPQQQHIHQGDANISAQQSATIQQSGNQSLVHHHQQQPPLSQTDWQPMQHGQQMYRMAVSVPTSQQQQHQPRQQFVPIRPAPHILTSSASGHDGKKQ